MMQSTECGTSAELVSLLDQANGLARAVGRSDPVERLARARARIAARRMRVLVVGTPGQGATSLVQVLEQASADRLPGASFLAAAGPAGANQPVGPEPGSAGVGVVVSRGGEGDRPGGVGYPG